MEITEAFISFSVDTTCPYCDHDFDIVDQLGEIEVDPWKENGTGRKHEITCPECGDDFEITIHY